MCIKGVGRDTPGQSLDVGQQLGMQRSRGDLFEPGQRCSGRKRPVERQVAWLQLLSGPVSGRQLPVLIDTLGRSS
jgi:hypothetical protein